MLVLSRRIGERIFVGNSITITVLDCRTHRAKIGIEAPTEVRIVREEALISPKRFHRLDNVPACSPTSDR